MMSGCKRPAQVVSSFEWAEVGQALRDGQPLPPSALSRPGVSMRLKAEVAQQRAASECVAEQVRPPIRGKYASQVCPRASCCVWLPGSSPLHCCRQPSPVQFGINCFSVGHRPRSPATFINAVMSVFLHYRAFLRHRLTKRSACW